MLICVIYIIFMICCLFLLFRNLSVYTFRKELLKLTSKYQTRHMMDEKWNKNGGAWEWFLGKYTYDDMMFSFKRLRLESWYTKEEIEEIMS